VIRRGGGGFKGVLPVLEGKGGAPKWRDDFETGRVSPANYLKPF